MDFRETKKQAHLCDVHAKQGTDREDLGEADAVEALAWVAAPRGDLAQVQKLKSGPWHVLEALS